MRYNNLVAGWMAQSSGLVVMVGRVDPYPPEQASTHQGAVRLQAHSWPQGCLLRLAAWLLRLVVWLLRLGAWHSGSMAAVGRQALPLLRQTRRFYCSELSRKMHLCAPPFQH